MKDSNKFLPVKIGGGEGGPGGSLNPPLVTEHL